MAPKRVHLRSHWHQNQSISVAPKGSGVGSGGGGGDTLPIPTKEQRSARSALGCLFGVVLRLADVKDPVGGFLGVPHGGPSGPNDVDDLFDGVGPSECRIVRQWYPVVARQLLINGVLGIGRDFRVQLSQYSVSQFHGSVMVKPASALGAMASTPHRRPTLVCAHVTARKWFTAWT